MNGSFILWIGLGLALAPIFVLILMRVQPLTILIFHIASRWVLDSIPWMTYSSIIGPFSIAKIYSILFTVLLLGYLIVRRWPFPRFLYLALLAICTPIIFATIVNGNWIAASEELLKWGYLGVLISLVLATAKEHSALTIMKWVSLIGLYPLINIGYSYISGNVFSNAGVLRYIGTYFHQKHPSYMMMTLIPASIYWVIMEKKTWLKGIPIGIVIGAHVGLFLASYRTIWIGIIVFWIIAFWAFQKRLSGGQKYVLYIMVPIILALTASQIWESMVERLEPAVEVISNPSEYINIDRFKRTRVLSGRLDIVNASLIAYSKAPLESIVFGLGPGSIRNITNKFFGDGGTYAHNQYLSFLVEFGIIGIVGLILGLWVLSKRIWQSIQYEDLISAFSFALYCGILAAAMSTMPFQNMLGLLPFGLYIALALSKSDASLQEFTTSSVNNERITEQSVAQNIPNDRGNPI